MQLPARAPTMAAMTAMSLDQLSGGRFIVGLGPSGPQVVEGWYGASYDKPLTRLREYIEIMRKVFAREAPVEYKGVHYQLPYAGRTPPASASRSRASCTASARSRSTPRACSPRRVAMSAELCDGFFPVWLNPERYDIFGPRSRRGWPRPAGQDASRTSTWRRSSPWCSATTSQQCRMPVKAMLALYIGGMGARGKNFYNDYATQLGYADAARKIQDLYLDGKKDEAMAAVPDQLVDDVALVRPARPDQGPRCSAGSRPARSTTSARCCSARPKRSAAADGRARSVSPDS